MNAIQYLNESLNGIEKIHGFTSLQIIQIVMGLDHLGMSFFPNERFHPAYISVMRRSNTLKKQMLKSFAEEDIEVNISVLPRTIPTVFIEVPDSENCFTYENLKRFTPLLRTNSEMDLQKARDYIYNKICLLHLNRTKTSICAYLYRD